MLSAPLKQTNEIDWVAPLKAYIHDQYGDDPERYSEECGMLNRLRQDMRGAGKDSASGRDLLYRYYGQLELLDLRFPVDENHIKISFTWFDAFTHKPTSQYSLAYEKASIIFNISAVLSCHAANQNRHEDTGLKTSYHSFQAAAGMFTYINENFLHAPSADLSRETVKTLIQLMLAQGQEVFLEKQVADQKKVGLLAKLASQAAYLYGQALEGVQENVTKAIFERVWLLVSQIKASHMASVAQYYQALADNDANSHGTAICRLQVAEIHAKDAHRIASSFPANVPSNSNLTSETGSILAEITKRHLSTLQEKLSELSKDNDYIYHQPVPNEAALSAIPKLPAAKAIPVSELYQGQDIQRIIGPDIFQRIVPMAVTESASMYDEEKAKLVRSEGERVEVANDEMAASLDYLKLPESLDILKGAKDNDIGVDADFGKWCEELAGHEPFAQAFDQLAKDKSAVNGLLDQSVKSLDMEESVCEKMRSKYGDDWTQQPSSRLTVTLRSDIKNYRQAIEEAATSDAQLYSTYRQFEADFEEMRSAGETDEADVLYQRAMIKAGAARNKGKSVNSPGGNEGNLLDEDFEQGPSVAEQISNIEELMKKLKLVKKEREQVLKDLKEKVSEMVPLSPKHKAYASQAHTDDISNVLILNKKSISNQDNQIFKTELEKFRPHQNRILQANHKQTSLLKELTRSFDALLQDKRVRAEQSKYEAFSRQRSSVLHKYRKIYQAFNDLVTGLMRAQGFYTEMKDTVESLHKNVETFVNNRRSEGGQLLSGIEETKRHGSSGGLVDWERERLKELMDRMSMDPSSSTGSSPSKTSKPNYPSIASSAGSQQQYTSPSQSVAPQFPSYTRPGAVPQAPAQAQAPNGSGRPADFSYQPASFGPLSPQINTAVNPPQPTQTYQPQNPYSPQPAQQYGQTFSPAQQQPPYQQHQHSQSGGASATTTLPPGWQPPPPPPGPPPSQDFNFGLSAQNYPAGPGGYASSQPTRQPQAQMQTQQQGGDPWSGLSGWK